MKIGFCYDITENHPLTGKDKEYTAEYESEETIQELSNLLSEIGQVIHLPWNKEIFNDLKTKNPDIVFNITESWGSRNRESFIPNICEILDIPCTGSDGVALGVSLDKALTKHIARSIGIRTPDFFKIETVKKLNQLINERELKYPFFIKPNNEGSSMGVRITSCVNSDKQLIKEARYLLEKFKSPVLIEKFLSGREFAVALLGNKNQEIFPVAEIMVDQGRFPFYSYEFKDKHKKTVGCPAQINDKTKNMMIRDTRKIFKALGCRDIGRADFKMDKQGKPHFVEINPLPGLSPFYSIYPLQAKKHGLELKEVIEKMLKEALKRHKKEDKYV